MTPDPAAISGLIIVTFCYFALCAVSPYGNCRRCRGFGFHLTTDRRGRLKRGRTCRRCRGHGKRARIGRLLLNRAARLHRDGTR